METNSLLWLDVAQVPAISDFESAKGPITATLALRSRGNTALSFFRSTWHSRASSRAKALFSSVQVWAALREGSRYLKGSSKRPSLYLASSILLQARSMSASLTLPSSRDLRRVPTKPSEFISISRPAWIARADTSWRSPSPWATISTTAVASDTTKPSKP